MIHCSKIKIHRIVTFCMVFFSLTTLFAQDLTDKEIGFDVAAMTANLTERGVKMEAISSEIIMMREMYKTRFVEMKKTEADFLQKIKNEQIATSNTSRTTTTSFATVITDIPQAEKDALQALYNSTNGNNWTNHAGWDFSTPVTSWDWNTKTGWYGVTVNNGHVISLEIIGNNLDGNIPLDTNSLSGLQSLLLSSNKLRGNIPPQISSLKNLVALWLAGNQLEGAIPMEIGLLPQLESLDLQYNNLSGNIPPQIGSLKNLVFLHLGGNQLEGFIPMEISLLPKLKQLLLNYNRLSGNVPPQISQLTNLETFWLHYNKLERSIPDLTNLVLLKQLSINNNKFRFVDFATEYSTYKTKIDVGFPNFFGYAPQAKTDVEETITGLTGNSVTLTMYADNRFTPDETYQWYNGISPNNVLISGATTRQYILSNLSASNSGDYYCISKHPQITNPLDTNQNLILERNPIHLNVITCTPVTGTLTVNTAALCMKQSSSFSFTTTTPNLTYTWTSTNSSGGLVNTVTDTTGSYSFVFDSTGNYTIQLEVFQTNGCKTVFSKNVTIDQCAPCDYCASFNLIKNEKYLVSAWVKEDNPATPQEQFKNFDKSCVIISFNDVAGTPIATSQKFYATGEIIDGWQRIIGEFIVPNNVDDMKLELLNENTDKTAYFDDIRVLPSKGNMKSFVYDQTTQRLMAELDENNYSTFYEYDLEGGLVRIKKETEKGVFTIQETRSGNTKSDKP